MKWGVHSKGDRESEGWVANRTSTTFALLVEGKLLIKMRRQGRVEEVRLEALGDYVLWEPGVEHCWEVKEDCIIFSVRCPSVAGDQIKQPL